MFWTRSLGSFPFFGLTTRKYYPHQGTIAGASPATLCLESHLLQSQKYSALHKTELLQPSSVVSVTVERTQWNNINWTNIYEIRRSIVLQPVLQSYTLIFSHSIIQLLRSSRYFLKKFNLSFSAQIRASIYNLTSLNNMKKRTSGTIKMSSCTE